MKTINIVNCTKCGNELEPEYTCSNCNRSLSQSAIGKSESERSRGPGTIKDAIKICDNYSIELKNNMNSEGSLYFTINRHKIEAIINIRKQLQDLQDKLEEEKMKEHKIDQIDEISEMKWTKEKPTVSCVFATRDGLDDGEYVYELWRFVWENCECECEYECNSRHYYLAWVTEDYIEWDDIKECYHDEYLVLGILPSMEEVHKKWKEDQFKNYGKSLLTSPLAKDS